MTIADTLAATSRAGVSLNIVADGNLQYEALPGRMTGDLREAVRSQKAALVELLTAFDADPVGAPYGPMIDAAREGRLRVPVFELSGFETVTDANVFVQWALGQVRARTHHRMSCLKGLAMLSERAL